MEFVTDNWTPLEPTLERGRKDWARTADHMNRALSEFEPRHYLAIIGLVLLLLSPIAWLLAKTWAAATLVAGTGLLLGSVALVLTPDDEAENSKE
jgi:type II secretory pathway component PulM